MNFRLELVPAPDGPAREPGSLAAALGGIRWLEPHADGHRYRSEATGVTFAVRAGDAGLVIEVPLVVPSFFGREIPPLLVALAERLRLRCQGSSDDDERREWGEEEIAAAFREANRAAVTEEWRAQRGDLPYLAEERLVAWWEHQRGLRDREEREGLLAPPVEILLDTRSGDVLLGSSWPDLAPRLLPEVDLLFVSWIQAFKRRRKGGALSRRPEKVEKEVGGYARVPDLLPFLERHAVRVEGPIPLFRYAGAGDARKAVGAVPLVRTESIGILDPNQVVDFRPPPPDAPPG